METDLHFDIVCVLSIANHANSTFINWSIVNLFILFWNMTVIYWYTTSCYNVCYDNYNYVWLDLTIVIHFTATNTNSTLFCSTQAEKMYPSPAVFGSKENIEIEVWLKNSNPSSIGKKSPYI